MNCNCNRPKNFEIISSNNIGNKKNQLLNSLFEVECFLNRFSCFLKAHKIYKIIKKIFIFSFTFFVFMYTIFSYFSFFFYW